MCSVVAISLRTCVLDGPPSKPDAQLTPDASLEHHIELSSVAVAQGKGPCQRHIAERLHLASMFGLGCLAVLKAVCLLCASRS